MHWLGLYVVKEIIDGCAVQLVKPNGEPLLGKVNDNWLKHYTGGPAIGVADQSIFVMPQGAKSRHEAISKCRGHRNRSREAFPT